MKKLPNWIGMAALAIAVAGLYAQHSAPEEAKPAAHETASKEGSGHGEGGHGSLEIWKWANFALLAGGLGYLVRKNAGPMFAARSQTIRRDMLDAEDLRQEAAGRVAEVDRRLANLEIEIAALRAEARAEGEAEAARVGEQTAADIAKVQAHTQQEIAAAGKAARMELKRYGAELALGLAERNIRARMKPEIQDALVRSFVRELPDSAQGAPSV
jgi:F-type H+-transporting ATPase subunit b